MVKRMRSTGRGRAEDLPWSLYDVGRMPEEVATIILHRVISQVCHG